MALAETKPARDEHMKQFAQDLKAKIHKVALYIDPSQKTVEYAILFVPNEMVFSFMNQKFPDLIDLAISERVLIVSPFTFLIVARTVLESYRNFMIEDKLRDMLLHIQQFAVEWDKYQEEFDKLGRSLESVRSTYESLQTTRTNQLTKRIGKIRSIEKTGVLSGSSPSTLQSDSV
jgi:DNA recombination protein RmuC